VIIDCEHACKHLCATAIRSAGAARFPEARDHDNKSDVRRAQILDIGRESAQSDNDRGALTRLGSSNNGTELWDVIAEFHIEKSAKDHAIAGNIACRGFDTGE